MQDLLESSVKENIQKLHTLISKIKTIENKIKKKKTSLEHAKRLYDCGFLDSIEFKRVSLDLQKEIDDLESELYEYLGSAKEILEETKKMLNFQENTEKTFSKKIFTIDTSEIKPILQQAEQVISSIKPPEDLLKPKRKSKIEVGKRFLELQKYLKSEESKTKKTDKKLPIRLKKKKKSIDINYKQYFVKISNRYFGKITDYLIKNFPELYTFVYESLKKAGVRMTVRTYVSTLLIIFTVSIIPTILFAIFVVRNPIYILLTFVAIMSGFVLFVFYYPEHLRKERANEIRALLPFVIIHMASLARSGLDPKHIFKIIADTDEYKALAEEFQKIVDYIEMGMGLSDAIRHVADTTPCQEFREFLDGLLLSLQSGASLKEFLDISAESAIIHYKALNQKFIQTIKTFSDIYVGMVITMPMILVSIIIMLASLAKNVFGLPIPLVTLLLVYVVIPALNIGMLLMISKIQPK